MKNKFEYSQNWGDDYIYSNDIISRYEEVESELEDYTEELERQRDDLLRYTTDKPGCEGAMGDVYEKMLMDIEGLTLDILVRQVEIDNLKSIIVQGEGYGNWSCGECLIHERAFQDYVEEFYRDNYGNEVNVDKWPFSHIDWASATEEFANDYTIIEHDGHQYYMLA